jgi:hypothetical protein
VEGLDNQAGMDERVPLVTPSSPEREAGDTANGVEDNSRDSAYQRYDIQQVARWIEQVLPFSLLLLVVFIRQHLQGTDHLFTLYSTSDCGYECIYGRTVFFSVYVGLEELFYLD